MGHNPSKSAGRRFAITLAAVAGGCSTISPDVRIQESVDLVARATGEKPDWLALWDDAPPPWSGHSVLRVNDAVALALRNNRDLRADIETIGQANADLVQAGLLQNPRLNFMAMFPDGGGRSMLRSSGFPLQPLQDLWMIPARKDAAAARLQDVVLRVADRAVETIADVKRAYVRIQYAQRAIELIDANLEIVEQTRRQVQTQQAAGQATLVEVSVPRIRYLRLQSEQLAMQAQYKTLKRQLLTLMGFPAATDDWTVTPIHELDEPIAPANPEESLLSTAAERRLDLLAAHWTVAAAGRQIEVMRRAGWPDLAVGLTFERAPAPPSQSLGPGARAGNALVGGLSSGAVETEPFMPFGPTPREVEWTLGPMIDLELPIFDRNHAQVARAVHEFRESCARFDAIRQSIVSQVRETNVMYEQAYQQVRFFRESILPEVERNLDVVRESYRAGGEEVTIFLQVQDDLIMTRLSALQFLRDLMVSQVELERQVGGRLEHDVAATESNDNSGSSQSEN